MSESISTFCPNNYNKTQIAEALKRGYDSSSLISGVDTRVTSIEDWKTNTAAPAISSLQSGVGTLSTSVTNLTRKVDNNDADIIDILNQIVWKGSINVLDLSSSELTIDTQSDDFEATIKNGVIIAKKRATTSVDMQFTLDNLVIDAGDYYACIGDNLGSSSNIYQMAIYDDNDTIIALFSNNDGSSVSDRGLTISNNITDGKIVFTLDKNYASNTYFQTIPIISETNNFDKDFIMPYFKPLAEVSQVESS